MDNDETLGHLLKIEAKAASLVNEAQAEADQRIAESEKKNRALYEERFRLQAEMLEAKFNKEKEKVREQYHRALEDYYGEISCIKTNMDGFSARFNEFLAGE